jgi:uncharacterized protein involved in exopolysaccharide biosynthesis
MRKDEARRDSDRLADSEDELSLLGALTVIVRRWRPISGIALGCALLGGIVAFLLPDRFTAYTSILPPQQSISAGAALLTQLGGPAAALMGSGGLGLRNANDLQVALLRSQTVEDAVIDRFQLMSRYRAKKLTRARIRLERNVEIDSGARDGLIRISVTDRDPRMAAAMANGYVQAFKQATAHLAITEASQRRVFFEEQLEQTKDNLAHAEEDLKRTEQKTGLIQPDSQARAVIASIAELRAQIAAKQVQIQGLKSFEAAENPDLEVAEQELAALKAQQAGLGGGGDVGSAALLLSKGNIQQLDLDYYRKLRDVKYYETIFDLLARQFEAAKVDEARQGTMVQVVDPAIVPDVRSSPKPALIIPFSLLLGGFFGIVWAISAEGMARLSRDPVESVRLQILKSMIFPHRHASESESHRERVAKAH